MYRKFLNEAKGWKHSVKQKVEAELQQSYKTLYLNEMQQ